MYPTLQLFEFLYCSQKNEALRKKNLQNPWTSSHLQRGEDRIHPLMEELGKLTHLFGWRKRQYYLHISEKLNNESNIFIKIIL